MLAVEVKQFVGENLKTLVPRVLGQTETARQKNADRHGNGMRRPSSRTLPSIRRTGGGGGTEPARMGGGRGLRIWWGKGKKDGSFFPMYDNKYGKSFLFSVWTPGSMELQFQRMNMRPFSEAEKRRELASRLAAIPGVSVPESSFNKRPSFKLGLLVRPGALDKFLAAFDWVLSEIKTTETRARSSG